MNKKIIFILSIIVLTIVLTGCGKDVITNNPMQPSNSRFVSIDDKYKIGKYSYRVYYDSRTNIVYLATGDYNSSGITVMYDKDGKPMTLKNYNKTK